MTQAKLASGHFGPSEVRVTSGANLGRPLFWSERLACAVTELSVHY